MRKTYRVPADTKQMKFLFAELSKFTSGFSLPKYTAAKLVLEEAFVNVASYAYDKKLPPESCPVLIKFVRTIKDLKITISDKGFPYNPLAREEVDISQTVHKDCPGGFGVHLIKQYADGVIYKRKNNMNTLTLIIKQR